MTGLVRLDDVQQLGFGFIGQTHAQPLSGHAQLIDGRHVIPQHHPVLVQHLRGGRAAFHTFYFQVFTQKRTMNNFFLTWFVSVRTNLILFLPVFKQLHESVALLHQFRVHAF